MKKISPLKKAFALNLIFSICMLSGFTETKQYPKVTQKTVTEDGVMFPGYSHPYKWNDEIKGDPVLFDEVW